METLTEKREEWYPIRVAYGRERSTVRHLAAAGYDCWIPACPAVADRPAAWVRSLLFVGPARTDGCPRPSSEFPFAHLVARTTHAPLRLDGDTMRRLRERFAATGSLDGLFESICPMCDRTSSPSRSETEFTQ